MAERGDMPWLEYYLAVKKGDLETVQKAKNKDFRMTLAMHKSAIELAALYGHLDLMNFFLNEVKIEKDLVLFTEVVKESLRGGHVDVAKRLLDFLGPEKTKSSIDVDVVRAAISGRNLECLKLVWEFAMNKKKASYGFDAFSSGSSEILRFIHECSTAGKFCEFSDLPPSYTWYGLAKWGNAKKACRKHEDREQQEHYVVTDNRESLERFTSLDAAAYFGQLEILKLLIQKQDDAGFTQSYMQSALKFALRNNHVEILQFLIEEEYVHPQPPYEYEGFKINDAFYFLKEKTSHIEMKEIPENLKKNLKEGLRVVRTFKGSEMVFENENTSEGLGNRKNIAKLREDRSASRLANISTYYEYLLESCGEKVGELDLEGLFMQALAEQNVDAALCFQKRMGKISCKTTNYHDYFGDAMCSRNFCFEVMTGTAVTELLLTTMTGSELCPCRKFCPLYGFVHWGNHQSRTAWPESTNVLELFRPVLPLELNVKRAEAVLEILFNHGVEAMDPDHVADVVSEFFYLQREFSVRAGKVLAILQCAKVNMAEIFVDTFKAFFAPEWLERDEFLTELLIALYRNHWRGHMQVSSLLIYFMGPPERKRHFVNCMVKTRVDVDHVYRSAVGARWTRYWERLEFMSDVLEQRDRVLSLQEHARYYLHRRALRIAHKGRKARRYISAKTVLDKAIEDLPVYVKNFVHFSDLYETLDYDPGVKVTWGTVGDELHVYSSDTDEENRRPLPHPWNVIRDGPQTEEQAIQNAFIMADVMKNILQRKREAAADMMDASSDEVVSESGEELVGEHSAGLDDSEDSENEFSDSENDDVSREKLPGDPDPKRSLPRFTAKDQVTDESNRKLLVEKVANMSDQERLHYSGRKRHNNPVEQRVADEFDQKHPDDVDQDHRPNDNRQNPSNSAMGQEHSDKSEIPANDLCQELADKSNQELDNESGEDDDWEDEENFNSDLDSSFEW